MGRPASHTTEQIFEAADRLAADGRDVTPVTLREALGGTGSFTTLGKGLDAWRAVRKAAPTPVVIEMPEAVTAAFAQCWHAAAVEAGKEIESIRLKADAEIGGAKRSLADALAEIERLEEDANADAAELATAQTALAQTVKDAQQAATAAGAREAALAATAKEMRQQIDAQQAELVRVHAEADAARKQHAAEVERITGDHSRHLAKQAADMEAVHAEVSRLRSQLAEAATAKADAARLTVQVEKQVADLAASRKEARTAFEDLARTEGELAALRSQVASLNDMVRSLAATEKSEQLRKHDGRSRGLEPSSTGLSNVIP